MRFKGFFRVMLLLIFSAVLQAEPLSTPKLMPDHFSFKAPLMGGSSSLRQVVLPPAVLEGMKRDDLGDLRIFSAEGQVVPHQFINTVQEDRSEKVTLVFYPLTQAQAADDASIRINVQQYRGRKQIEVETDKSQPTSALTHEFQYIIENRLSQKKLEKQLCQLILDWDQPKPSMILPLKIEVSDNLQQWSVLSARKSISKLKDSRSQLIRAQIEMPCTTKHYLRLQWLDPQQGVKVKQITGRYHQAGSKKMQWHQLGQPSVNERGDWLFEKQTVFPLNHLRLKAPFHGLLYQGELFSKKTAKGPWIRRQSLIQYRLKMENTVLESDPIRLFSGNDHYWKIKLADNIRFTPSQYPEIYVSQQQQQVMYLAQGTAPFTLAYGHTKIEPVKDSGIYPLMNKLKTMGGRADQVTLGAVEKINQPIKWEFKPDFPWKVIGLWLILLLGLLVMGYMAYSLHQQMNKKPKA